MTQVLLGLGAILGAGLFSGLAPAAALAGWWLLPGLVLAAAAALCSAFSTADQARAYPDATGYGYIRSQLGAWPGRLGASAYLLGRVTIASAIAMTFGNYVFPNDAKTAAVVLLTAGVALGSFRWNTGNWMAGAIVLGALGLVVVVCFAVAPAVSTAVAPAGDGLNGIFGAAGLMFIAFAGFERITAHPARGQKIVIPIMIVIALVTYLAVGAAALRQLGPARLALSPAPLRDAMIAADAQWLVLALQAGVAVASVSALYFVLAGTRRTMTAMVGTGDLPPRLAFAPRAVDVLAGAAAVIAVLLVPVPTALAVAACATLFYYAFTNASARILLQEDRTWPMRTACLGLGLSVLLAMSLPVSAMLITGIGLAAGTALFGLSGHRATGAPTKNSDVRVLG